MADNNVLKTMISNSKRLKELNKTLKNEMSDEQPDANINLFIETVDSQIRTMDDLIMMTGFGEEIESESAVELEKIDEYESKNEKINGLVDRITQLLLSNNEGGWLGAAAIHFNNVILELSGIIKADRGDN